MRRLIFFYKDQDEDSKLVKVKELPKGVDFHDYLDRLKQNYNSTLLVSISPKGQILSCTSDCGGYDSVFLPLNDVLEYLGYSKS